MEKNASEQLIERVSTVGKCCASDHISSDENESIFALTKASRRMNTNTFIPQPPKKSNHIHNHDHSQGEIQPPVSDYERGFYLPVGDQEKHSVYRNHDHDHDHVIIDNVHLRSVGLDAKVSSCCGTKTACEDKAAAATTPSSCCGTKVARNPGTCCGSEPVKASSCCGSEPVKVSSCCGSEPVKASSCCESKVAKSSSCCGGEAARKTTSCCDDSSCSSHIDLFSYEIGDHTTNDTSILLHSVTRLSGSVQGPNGMNEEFTEHAVAIVIDQKCVSCDATSSIPHALQVTRFRIANLCCAGEERIIRTSLSGVHGIDRVDVNIISRYAVVRHCPVICCAPNELILQKLNEKRLGASVAEALGEEQDEEELSLPAVKIIHLLSVFTLFLLGVILTQSPSSSSSSTTTTSTTSSSSSQQSDAGTVMYLLSTALGLLPVLYAACLSLYRHTIDIHILVVIAASGAIALTEYFDASLLMFLFSVAEALEQVIMVYVRQAVKVDPGNIPKYASLVNGKIVLLQEVKVDDVVCVRAGEMVMVDGVIRKGEGAVDESSLTGEARPVNKRAGDTVKSGTIVQNGYIEVVVKILPNDSTLNRLREEMLNVQADKGTYGRLIDHISLYWTPIVLLIALAIAVIGGGVTGDWHTWVFKALVLLVLACPCALVVSAPIPSVCTIAAAAKLKVLVRGSTVIEKGGKITAIALDKTGTLTKGFFKVTHKLLLPVCELEGYDALQLAASVEARSTHPLATAIVSEYSGCIAEMTTDLLQAQKIKVLEGKGVEGWVEVAQDQWRYVTIGNDRLLQAPASAIAQGGGALLHASKGGLSPCNGTTTAPAAVTTDAAEVGSCCDDHHHHHCTPSATVPPPSPAAAAAAGASRASAVGGGTGAVVDGRDRYILDEFCKVHGATSTVIYVCVDGQLAAVLALADEIRPEAAAAVEGLQRLLQSNHAVCMLTGDSPEMALKVCEQVGISSSDCFSRLFPQDKLNWVTSKEEIKGQYVCMVGDGINDSISLAGATIGVAMGSGGTAMAAEAADIVMMCDTLLALPRTLSLCRQGRNIIIQNCVFTIVIKIIAVVLAVIGGLQFWQAVLVDIGTLVIVVLNGIRPLRVSTLDVTLAADTPKSPVVMTPNSPGETYELTESGAV